MRAHLWKAHWPAKQGEGGRNPSVSAPLAYPARPALRPTLEVLTSAGAASRTSDLRTGGACLPPSVKSLRSTSRGEYGFGGKEESAASQAARPQPLPPLDDAHAGQARALGRRRERRRGRQGGPRHGAAAPRQGGAEGRDQEGDRGPQQEPAHEGGQCSRRQRRQRLVVPLLLSPPPRF